MSSQGRILGGPKVRPPVNAAARALVARLRAMPITSAQKIADELRDQLDREFPRTRGAQ